MFTKMNDLPLFNTEAFSVLFVLASNPYEEFYQRQIARLSKASVGYVNKVMAYFEKHNLVSKTKKGKMFFYRYNLDNTLSREIKKLNNILELKLLVAELKDVSKKIILFGSCAEGTDTLESDIDILIITQDRVATRSIINTFKSKLNRTLSPLIMTSTRFAELKRNDAPLYERIMSGVTL